MSVAATTDHSEKLGVATNFMSHYAAALDRRDLNAWVDFFAEEASYAVVSSENETAGWPVSLIDDGSRSKIEDRVRFIRDVWDGSYNDYLQRHILSTPLLTKAQSGSMDIEQSFAVYATDLDLSGESGGRSTLLCVGRYQAGITGSPNEPKLSKLKAILDTCTLTQSLVYPI